MCLSLGHPDVAFLRMSCQPASHVLSLCLFPDSNTPSQDLASITINIISLSVSQYYFIRHQEWFLLWYFGRAVVPFLSVCPHPWRCLGFVISLAEDFTLLFLVLRFSFCCCCIIWFELWYVHLLRKQNEINDDSRCHKVQSCLAQMSVWYG